MEGLCRVCGSPGNYDIFGKIPRFLNLDRRDLWQLTINKMVTDVTGIPISKHDGLPERICGLCISYLKHAVSFRNRAIQTRLSLVSAAFVMNKDPSEDFGMLRDRTLEIERVAAIQEPSAVTPEKKTVDEVPVVTSRKLQRFFDYEEKTFVEDDMTLFDAEVGIEINHPEVFRERKCGFCLKRFMLEDTYDEHLDSCLYRTLIEFIKDSNYIVRLKDEVAISNHEFIRRMVFAIQRVNKAIRGMHLPASVGLLIDDQSKEAAVPNNNNNSPGKVFQHPPPPVLTPKVSHFFQQSFKYPPPPLPMSRNANNSNNNSPSIPYNRPTRRKNEDNLFFKDNFTPKNQRSSRLTSSSNNRSSSGSIILQTPSPVNSSASDSSGIRRVVCKFCDKTFLTITHLDGHMIKDHT